ncbi:MAG: hypothetical protein JWR38_5780 [Mucilaginibacter sp.]|nr:hypothetical protein [Mucilaginibacter sp.]
MLTTKQSPENTANVQHNNPFFSSHLVQPRLQVNEPGDKYEQEADSMADRVMRMIIPSTDASPFFQSTQTDVQRKCQHCEEEEKLHRKESSSAETHGSNELDSYVGSLSTSGQPLPENSRQFFEPRFGQDFSNVRVHTDSVAAKSAQSINALAYTTGSDIVFNSGQYSPESDSGKRLMAHELTHVVQQGGSNVQTKQIQRLGANNGCNATQAGAIHQAIYDARGWINNMQAKVTATPNGGNVLGALRRNFGPTHGVAANLNMIVERIQTVFRLLSNLTVNCDPGTDAICVAGNCGFTIAGSHLSTVCPHTITAAGNYLIGCVLHEAFHAAFDTFTVDEYSGWHGAAQGTAGYPGPGGDPLINADSYTSFVIDLS